MVHTKMENEYYYTIFSGCGKTRWLADERAKKQFLDQLLKLQGRGGFRIYAFCLLDAETHFLLEIPEDGDFERTVAGIAKKLKESVQLYGPDAKREPSVWKKKISPCSHSDILEYCCRIHLLAARYAERIQDYWWSSYVDYRHRNITGLVATEAVLHILDSEPRRALQKFVQYHEKYALLIEDEQKRRT